MSSFDIDGVSVEEANEETNRSAIPESTNYKWWLRVAVYSLMILTCESAATILERLYYENGGKSKWMGTLVQHIGFPILLPYHTISSAAENSPTTNRSLSIHSKSPSSSLIIAAVHVFLGLLVAAYSLLHSIGLFHLPVTTFSLICASQLAFNAIFSFFLNSQKFTANIVNSLVLLTISSTLLLLQPNSSGRPSHEVLERNSAIGFICTISGSAGYGLVLSLKQFIIQNVIKMKTFSVVIDMAVYQSVVASCATIVGLFASGEWRGLNKEMYEFGLGKVSYLMILIWTSVSWKVLTIGEVGMILEVSSLFSNAVSVLSLPLVPVLAVIFLHESLDGIRVVAMVLSIWGFISFVYQHYLDDHDMFKTENRDENWEKQDTRAGGFCSSNLRY
ncbi:hypothetical protein FNV43_RR05969 [Rhamnella rubrinervis]|uniref:Probable purine permease n=1 Tax=Rhamnella rubrinervis TaxID=2594499 RepID=A0A8K0HCQ7_9ROSA|nr:hypothetical protein FNV43_RR05969 [Rhamnella rubrinervis]